MEENEPKFYMTPKEVAEYLNVSLSAVYRYLHEHKNPLPHYKLGRGSIRIKRSDIDPWIGVYFFDQQDYNDIEKENSEGGEK